MKEKQMSEITIATNEIRKALKNLSSPLPTTMELPIYKPTVIAMTFTTKASL
jgi:predicted nucleotidyltransferase